MTRLSPATLRHSTTSLLAACLFLIPAVVYPAAGRIPPRLILLAREAKNKHAWPALARYARANSSKTDRGWALFVLGYREYDAGDFASAQRDLGAAAQSGFPFSGLATYYEASAAYQNGEPGRTVELLQEYSERYAKSSAVEDAEELLAWAYLQTGKPAEAIRVLAAIPDVREKPKLALLLARAEQQSDRPEDAAATYQGVYYAFPGTAQARIAAQSLAGLKESLGPKFPRVSDQIATARARKLAEEGDCSQAIEEYGQLLKERRESALAWQWNLGRARCLLRTKKPDQAIETLVGTTPVSAAIDAERLEILAEAYIQKKDETSTARMLKQLETSYSSSPSYAQALLQVADYYMDKPDLEMAAKLDHTLASAFPGTAEGAVGSWWEALTEYLQGKREEAQAGFKSVIKLYPSSARVPASIYFLGRLAEQAGNGAEAREYYDLVRTRFVHDYYAIKAEQRIRSLIATQKRQPGRRASADSVAVREIADLIPGSESKVINACDPGADSALLDPYFDLHTLGLDELARKAAWTFSSQSRRSEEFLMGLSKLDALTGRPDLAIHRVKQVAPEYDRSQFDDLPAGIWDLLYPRSYWSVVRSRAASTHLDPYFVMALIRQESGFYPQATSSADARGLMQILPDTASNRPSRRVVERLFEPYFNIRLGCIYLRELLNRYKGNLAAALAAYNAGPSRVDEWMGRYPSLSAEEFIETIPFPGTRVYVKAVFRDAVMYRMMLTGAARYKTCGSRQKPRRRTVRHGRISH